MTEENGTKKIDKYFAREFGIIIVVAGILLAFYNMVLSPLQQLKSDIIFIKDNHLSHIETQITEIRKKQADRDISDAERDKKLERILTILEKDYKIDKK